MTMTVLYEDQAAVKPTNYGPHILVLQCVADRVGGDPRGDLKPLSNAKPMKGSGNLRKELRERGALLQRSGPVVIMVDDDKIRGCYQDLGLARTSCKSQVIAAIKSECSGVDPGIVLLNQNMETVLNVCLRALGRPPLNSKPSPEERDQILMRCASPAVTPAQRQEILDRVPTLGRLVCILAGWAVLSRMAEVG